MSSTASLICSSSAPPFFKAATPVLNQAPRCQEAKPAARPWNPLHQVAAARRHSSYAAFEDGAIQSALAGEGLVLPSGLAQAHADFRAHVLHPDFPCVGAKSAFNRNRYRTGLYPGLASAAAVNAVCHDLYEFNHEFAHPGDDALTFVAMFDSTPPLDDQAFEQQLWSHLQKMHAVDAQFFPWDPCVSADPESTEFSFSVGERAFFIVGLHPHASRVARRSPQVTIIFNLHQQFEGLRLRGKYESMKKVIRSRDLALQGSINPVLQNFGDSSEARQYSGRPVSESWRCPFLQLHSSSSSS